MAVSITLKFKDIKGESQIKGHEGEIDILSWSGGSGSADVEDLHLTKYIDKASPVLMDASFKGKDLKEATLYVMKVSGAGKPIEYLRISMSGTVFVSAIHQGEQLPNDRHGETLDLNFRLVKIEHTGQKADGSADATISHDFDIAGQH
jgi:type VI secretion system secreted protein Hcp